MKLLITNPTAISQININNESMTSTSYIDINGCSYFDMKDNLLTAISDNGISVFNVENRPKLIYQDSTMSVKPSHISYINQLGLILASNYHLGFLRIYKINQDSITSFHDINYPVGSKIHQALYNPFNKLIYVVDLGLDSVYIYQVQTDNLILVKTIELPKNSGPRHLTFNQDYMYCLTEYSNQVFHYDNNFNLVNTYMTLTHFYEKSDSSAIRISPNNKYLYTLNRIENYITHFNINNNGSLTYVKSYPTYGDHARDFNISNDNKYLVIANMSSNNLTLFKIDNDGALTLVNDKNPYEKGLMLMFI